MVSAVSHHIAHVHTPCERGVLSPSSAADGRKVRILGHFLINEAWSPARASFDAPPPSTRANRSTRGIVPFSRVLSLSLSDPFRNDSSPSAPQYVSRGFTRAVPYRSQKCVPSDLSCRRILIANFAGRHVSISRRIRRDQPPKVSPRLRRFSQSLSRETKIKVALFALSTFFSRADERDHGELVGRRNLLG